MCAPCRFGRQAVFSSETGLFVFFSRKSQLQVQKKSKKTSEKLGLQSSVSIIFNALIILVSIRVRPATVHRTVTWLKSQIRVSAHQCQYDPMN